MRAARLSRVIPGWASGGEVGSVPFRDGCDQLPDNYWPKSGTAAFSNSLDRDMDDNAIVRATIELWRKQRRG